MATTTTPLAAIARSIGSAVQIEHGGKRPRALRLVDASHQLSSTRCPQEVDFAHLELEVRRGIVGRLHACPPLGHALARKKRWQAGGRCEHGQLLQKAAALGAMRIHVDLLGAPLYSRSPPASTRGAGSDS